MKLSGLIGSYSGIELWQHPAVSRGARFAGTTCCIYFSAVEQVHCRPTRGREASSGEYNNV